MSGHGRPGHLPLCHDEEDAAARTPQGHQVNLYSGCRIDCGDAVIFIGSRMSQFNHCQLLADPSSLQNRNFFRVSIKGSTIMIVS